MGATGRHPRLRRGPGGRRVLSVVALALLAGCISRELPFASAMPDSWIARDSGPPSHLVRLWPEGHEGDRLLGVSTTDGIVTLAQPAWKRGHVFELQFPHGNGMIQGYAVLQRRNDDLAVLEPVDARLLLGRVAETRLSAGEDLCISIFDGPGMAEMEDVDLWHGGQYGDYIEVDASDPGAFAARWAGAGVYVERDEGWRLVGLVSGLTAEVENSRDVAVGFLGLDELGRILPGPNSYFERPILPQRPDFDFGVPLQPGDLKAPKQPKPKPTPPEPPPEPEPEPEPEPDEP